jgi:hypothetical protein
MSNKTEYCPICHEKWISQCKCMIGEKTCINDHSWFTCPVHHKIIIGKSDHGLGLECQCKK